MWVSGWIRTYPHHESALQIRVKSHLEVLMVCLPIFEINHEKSQIFQKRSAFLKRIYVDTGTILGYG
jgi:hypothetical protein